jgi:hypothetical protein
MNRATDYSIGKAYRLADNKLMTVIIACTLPGNIGNPFKKFHNVPKRGTGKSFDTFILFAGKFPGISHINCYEKVKQPGQQRGSFIEQIQMQ